MTFVPSTSDFSRESSSNAVWFAVGKRGLLVRRDTPNGAELRAFPQEVELEQLGIPIEPRHRLGTRDGRPVFAISVPDAVALPPEWTLLGLRGLVEAFDEETFAIAGHASHVLDWATTSQFCGRCGQPTVPVETERCMKCPECALMTYPRIAPAVIVLVRRGREALLARNARFPVPFYSTLAGFSGIGETLEDTLAREIFEEVGVRAADFRYFGSQPWPFPNSLMVAFTAEWVAGDIAVDNVEIADAQWFSPESLPIIPPRISIARRLIDAWVEETAGRATA